MQRTFPANWLVSIALVPILGMVAPIAAYSQDFPSLPDIDTSTSDNGVVPTPENSRRGLSRVFKVHEGRRPQRKNRSILSARTVIRTSRWCMRARY